MECPSEFLMNARTGLYSLPTDRYSLRDLKDILKVYKQAVKKLHRALKRANEKETPSSTGYIYIYIYIYS